MINKTIIELTKENELLMDKLRMIKILACTGNWGITELNIKTIAKLVKGIK